MDESGERTEDRPFAITLFLACGIAAPVFFVAVFLIAGAMRPDYSALRHPVSSLSLEAWGWVQVVNFVITGTLLLAFAIGVRLALLRGGSSTWGPMLLRLVGFGFVGAGIFVNDPLNSYPPGTPLVPTERTVHGRIHDLFGVLVFLGLPAACLVYAWLFARREKGRWAAYSALSGIAMLAAFALAAAGFDQVPGLSDFAGLFQRLSLAFGLGWTALLAVHLLRTTGNWPQSG